MKHGRLFSVILSLVLVQGAAKSAGNVADWTQWHGPDRTGLSKETGLMKSWPATGPAVTWTASNIGEGYGSVSMQGERVFVQGAKGSDSLVFALNRADGKIAWSQALGPKGDDSRGGGPRGTPTIDGDKLYALSENGDLACLKINDGAVVWRRNILKDFGGKNPGWLISESPLVDGNNLIVTPGGQGASLVALDKTSGKTVWTSKELSDQAGYSSCLAADVQGVRTIIGFTAGAAVGVRADGRKAYVEVRAGSQ